MQLKMLWKLLLFLFLLLPLWGEASNVTNTSFGWKSPSEPSVVFRGYFGGPGGGGGPGAPSVDVFISVRVELPSNLVDTSSVQALVAAVSHEVEEQTGLHFIDVGSTLVPQAPHTIIVTGALFGGALQCPFYHEKQIASQCGLHVVNMLLGRRQYTRDSFMDSVNELRTEYCVLRTLPRPPRVLSPRPPRVHGTLHAGGRGLGPQGPLIQSLYGKHADASPILIAARVATYRCGLTTRRLQWPMGGSVVHWRWGLRDESVVLHKGMLAGPLKMFFARKPHPTGIKLYCLADTTLGYVVDMYLYTAARGTLRRYGTAAGNFDAKNIMKFWASLLREGTALCADSFFGSHGLAKELAANERALLMMTKRSTYGVTWAGEHVQEG